MTINPPALAITVVAATAGVTALLGGGLLNLMRRRSVISTLAGTVIIAVVAMFVGVVTATIADSIPPADAHLLWAASGAGGLVSIVIALRFGQSILDATRTLEKTVRRVGQVEDLDQPQPPTTELTELADELDRTNTRLVQFQQQQQTLERSRRELVAWMSHDLRAPLAAVRAMAEALEDQVVVDEGTVARYHAGIRVEADRLAGMIENLFELSRIHAGTVATYPQRLSLSDLISDAVAAIAPLAESKNVTLQGQADEPLAVDVDPLAFARALSNLLTNGIVYSASGGTVNITARGVGDRAVIEIADQCGGISEAELVHVFEPSFRGTSAAVTRQPGAGLGLAIVQGVINAHHGTVNVHNDSAGCCFVVTIPAAPEEPAHP